VSFTAKFPGDCRDCDAGILPGQEVEFDFDRVLMHVVCPDTLQAVTGKPRPLCPQCFMELPVTGRCDCRE
jgi:hypothetical protein